jgi:hypothetical protein
MLKNVITEDKLRALKRVEDWIASHPDCTASELGLALGIKRTTLNGYTLALRTMGRVTATSQGRAGVHGTLPDTFRIVPGCGPLPTTKPAEASPRTAHAIDLEPAQRMDLVAALFGPAPITS